MQMCEATDRNRIVKSEGVEASWHMTAKPTGLTPMVNAALVHRQFAFLPGEICVDGGQRDRDDNPAGPTGQPRTRRRSELPAASEEIGSPSRSSWQRVRRQRRA